MDVLDLAGFKGRMDVERDEAAIEFSDKSGRTILVRFPRARLQRVASGLLQLIGELDAQSRTQSPDQPHTEAVMPVAKFGASISENGTPVLEIEPQSGPRFRFEVAPDQLEALEEWFRIARLSLRGETPVSH